MSRQVATSTCECGAPIRILPTVSRWEFEYACEVCRRGGVISWAHIEEPPVYEVPPLDVNLPLFDEEKP